MIHPKEARNRVGTGRMASLCLEDSVLIEGVGADLDENPRLIELLNNPGLWPCVLYPGPDAQPRVPRHAESRRPLVIVIDGTWHQARRMIGRSRLLKGLPRMGLNPVKPSDYRIREQPRRECLSTIEAIHAVVEQESQTREHDRLIEVFQWMVELQESCEEARQSVGGVIRGERLRSGELA